MVTRSAARRGMADAAGPQPGFTAGEVSSSVDSPESAFGLGNAAGGRNSEPSSSGGNLGAERLQRQRSWFGSSRWVAARLAADESGALENLGAAVGSALWQYVNQRGEQSQTLPGDQPGPNGQGRRGSAGRERTDL
jgi:hypothetical protein